jgi:predicted anti-sigma-YlaC factor YlaD
MNGAMKGGIECARWQEAISARLDGEDPGIDPALVDAHLARCWRCQAFAADAALALVACPSQRTGAAAAVPDLSKRIRSAVAASDRAGHWGIVRALLVVVAVEIIAFSLPALILGDEQDTAAHAARHLGAFTAAYGVGLLVVAIRPARARTMLPVTVVLAGALLITAVVDLVNGRVPLVGEAQHLPELLSVVLVWLLAVPAPVPPIRVSALRQAPGERGDDDRRGHEVGHHQQQLRERGGFGDGVGHQ